MLRTVCRPLVSLDVTVVLFRSSIWIRCPSGTSGAIAGAGRASPRSSRHVTRYQRPR